MIMLSWHSFLGPVLQVFGARSVWWGRPVFRDFCNPSACWGVLWDGQLRPRQWLRGSGALRKVSDGLGEMLREVLLDDIL